VPDWSPWWSVLSNDYDRSVSCELIEWRRQSLNACIRITLSFNTLCMRPWWLALIVHCSFALNSFQSAYTKFHSTESTLLSVHDHIKAMSQQKITALCLLDLSAAFDTIDHSILTHHLSAWFGLKGTILSWLQSYLFSRSFIININATLSPTFLGLLQGVPQGSVLDPLIFIRTPLCSISSLLRLIG